MKVQPIVETDQPNGHLEKDASIPPSSLPISTSSQLIQPLVLTQSTTTSLSSSSSPSPPPLSTTPSNMLLSQASQMSSQRDSDEVNQSEKPTRQDHQAFLERNKMDKLFDCLRKVGSAIQELVEEGTESASTFNSSAYNSPPSYRSKEEVPPLSNHLPHHSKVTKDFGCQKNGSVSYVHRSVGDRNPVIRTMEEYEALESSDQRRYLISQLDAYSRQYFKMIEDKERRRRKLCHLQSEFISLMLPQFSIIHSIMAEGLRNEWQNKLKIIDELTRTLSDCDERLTLNNEGYSMRDQSISGINLSLINHQHHLQSHHSFLQKQQRTIANNGEGDNEDEYENEEDETFDHEELSSRNHQHHNNLYNGNLAVDPSHHEIGGISAVGEEMNSSAEQLRLATERFAQLTKRNVEDAHIEDGSGLPVDLTTDSEIVNQFARFCDASVSKRQYSRKPPAPPVPPSSKYVNNIVTNNGNSDPASPKPTGLHKYKICLFRDGGYRCYYIGKDRSCNMRQHWLHRHGVDNPPEHFYARKDLSDTEVQKYKLKYEVQKSNFPKNRDPLVSTIFHQQSPAKRAKLSPTQQENTPQA
ncbi:uncharacterized protein LOC128389326 [Panonychus citri]|uniref:uncharacterized protein LOC128389326 n=1 Tax=Panonychus citri TaxID=50023 RepID=UPI0023078F05|nr:uncharacterized protein LOC128389326 [Panonychus citri]XP_053204864.1 uncharacterized protein LOC128389326 [Panonychus citri]